MTKQQCDLLTTDEKNHLQEYFQKFGYILFKPNEFQEYEIPKDQATKRGLSMSQLLRQSIWKYWKNSNSTLSEEDFYKDHMEKLIAFIETKNK